MSYAFCRSTLYSQLSGSATRLSAALSLPSKTLSRNATRFVIHRPTQRFLTTLRRKRKKYEKFHNPQAGTQLPVLGMEQPLAYAGESLEEYAEKANLSPWTPVPDSVARKIFDRADPGPEDVHVELGSGDGRVNFFAIDAGVQRSVGIDVDGDIIDVANNRLNRIHPKPNLKFLQADLMDSGNEAWNEVQQASILTMYFAKDGLEKIRPLIEQTLRGKRCKIFTCGYPMPGWDAQMIETVLDMPIHFYDWGNTDVEGTILTPDSMIDKLSPDFRSKDLGMDKFSSQKKNTSFKSDPLKGFHPDDLVDFAWDDFNDEGEAPNPQK